MSPDPSSAMGGLRWFRMYSEAIDDEKLRLLAFEDRWHYVALLCCKAKGLLDTGDEWSMFQRKVAVKLGVQARELEEIHRRLLEVDLVDEYMQPVAWDKRQFRSDHDPSRNDRQRRFRERRQGSNALHNAPITEASHPPEAEAEAYTEETHTASPSDAEGVNGTETLGQLFTPEQPPAPPSPRTTVNRFEEFWDAYPRIRRRKKKQSLEIWRRKRLDAKADEIIGDVQARQERDGKWMRGFSPEPTAYLNGELWNDEYEDPGGESAPKRETLQPDSLGRPPRLADGSPNPDYRGGNYWT